MIKRRLSRELTRNEIYKLILGVQIEALEKLLEKRELKEYEFLCEGTNFSLDMGENLAQRYLDTFMEEKEDPKPEIFLREFAKYHVRWFNTLRSILYMCEAELLFVGCDKALWELWDLFFQAEDRSDLNYKPQLGLKTPTKALLKLRKGLK